AEVTVDALDGARGGAVAFTRTQQALARAEARREPRAVLRERRLRAGEGVAVAHAAAGLDDARARQVGQRDQHARREREEASEPPGLVGEHARDDEARAADLD